MDLRFRTQKGSSDLTRNCIVMPKAQTAVRSIFVDHLQPIFQFRRKVVV
jgi:hypothetical protein